MSDAEDDLDRAHRIGRPIGRFMERWRAMIRKRPWLNAVYKVLITAIGVLVVAIGVVLIPLPGPGWLIVFIGMTILGSEYHWARRLTSWLRMTLARFWARWNAWRARRRARKAERQGAAVAEPETDPEQGLVLEQGSALEQDVEPEQKAEPEPPSEAELHGEAERGTEAGRPGRMSAPEPEGGLQGEAAPHGEAELGRQADPGCQAEPRRQAEQQCDADLRYERGREARARSEAGQNDA